MLTGRPGSSGSMGFWFTAREQVPRLPTVFPSPPSCLPMRWQALMLRPALSPCIVANRWAQRYPGTWSYNDLETSDPLFASTHDLSMQALAPVARPRLSTAWYLTQLFPLL